MLSVNFVAHSKHFVSYIANIMLSKSQRPIGSESVPIELAQCWSPGLAISNAKIWIGLHFSNKIYDAISSNSTRKLLWFESAKMLIAVLTNKFIVLFVITSGTYTFVFYQLQYSSPAHENTFPSKCHVDAGCRRLHLILHCPTDPRCPTCRCYEMTQFGWTHHDVSLIISHTANGSKK